jgi:beta-galactosidase GanA
MSARSTPGIASGGIAFGGDYNPEQWPRGTWIADTVLGVEVVRRRGDATSCLFVLNHTARPATIAANGVDLSTGNAVTGKLELAAGDVAVIREERG